MVSFTARSLYPRERAPRTYWIGGWVDPRASLDDVEKRKFLTLPGLELRHLDRPARSQSLSRLRYPGYQQWTAPYETLRASDRYFSKLPSRIFGSCGVELRTMKRIISEDKLNWNKYVYVCTTLCWTATAFSVS
jgi:hypothetical protein